MIQNGQNLETYQESKKRQDKKSMVYLHIWKTTVVRKNRVSQFDIMNM